MIIHADECYDKTFTVLLDGVDISTDCYKARFNEPGKRDKVWVYKRLNGLRTYNKIKDSADYECKYGKVEITENLK